MIIIDSLRIMTTLKFIKSLPTSLFQREGECPSLAKRGAGRFFGQSKFNYEILSKFAVVLVIFVAFIVSGCKGKEEKQAVVAPLSQEQQEKAVAPPAPGGAIAPASPRISPEVLADTPPRITSLKFSPETPVAGDKVKALVETFDKEGDSVTVEYHWAKNGSPLFETSDTLTLSEDFKRGDKITVTAAPDDGKRKGNPVSANLFVANSLPVMKPSQETFRYEGREYSYQMKAVDPDGDTLTYSLKAAPQGMTIDSAAGLIKWSIPPGFKGKSQVIVSVADGHGGEVLQSFSLEIRPEQK